MGRASRRAMDSSGECSRITQGHFGHETGARGAEARDPRAMPNKDALNAHESAQPEMDFATRTAMSTASRDECGTRGRPSAH